MPIYTYSCPACHHTHDQLLNAASSPPEPCPTCGHKPLTKLINKVNFHLKGAGFYANDYANNWRKRSAANPNEPDEQDLELIGKTRPEYEWDYGQNPNFAHDCGTGETREEAQEEIERTKIDTGKEKS